VLKIATVWRQVLEYADQMQDAGTCWTVWPGVTLKACQQWDWRVRRWNICRK
jgi:hypothetical protein